MPPASATTWVLKHLCQQCYGVSKDGPVQQAMAAALFCLICCCGRTVLQHIPPPHRAHAHRKREAFSQCVGMPLRLASVKAQGAASASRPLRLRQACRRQAQLPRCSTASRFNYT